MSEQEKLDNIHTLVIKIDKSLALLTLEVKNINEHGTKKSAARLDSVEIEVATAKGIAKGGSIVSTFIATLAAIFAFLRGH